MTVDETESLLNFLAGLLFLVGVVLFFDYIDSFFDRHRVVLIALLESLFTLTFLYTVLYTLLCVTSVSLCYYLVYKEINLQHVIFAFAVLLLQDIADAFFTINNVT